MDKDDAFIARALYKISHALNLYVVVSSNYGLDYVLRSSDKDADPNANVEFGSPGHFNIMSADSIENMLHHLLHSKYLYIPLCVKTLQAFRKKENQFYHLSIEEAMVRIDLEEAHTKSIL